MKKFVTLLGFCLLVLSQGVTKEEKRQTEFTILSDVLQPIGIPLVSSYHKMRENVFLNTRTNRENPIEALGNVLLLPSRYLFAGKRVHIPKKEEAGLEVNQCFTYRRFHWFKTPLAIITLPVSIVAGSFVKTIGYISPNARKHHRAIKARFTSPKVERNFELYKLQGLETLKCEEYSPSLNHARPSHILKKHQVEVEALKELVEVLEKNNIVYWIDCGTCLGAYRYKGFIPWDGDIDIAILTPDHDNVKRLLKGLDRNKYVIQDWSSYSCPKTFMKLYIKKTKTLIDIYHYSIDNHKKTISYFFTYLNSPFPKSWKKSEIPMTKPLAFSTVFPLKKAYFDGLTLWAPNDIETFLKSKYGENLEPTMVWDDKNQIYHKVKDHPYWKNND